MRCNLLGINLYCRCNPFERMATVALKPNANVLIALCSAPFSDAQQIVHHDEMTAVDGKMAFFTEFMAHFVGKMLQLRVLK